jgi:ADP-dependent NAD(P)H-hydrate dehydratase / NAD(P)H-hydrate epimerase
MRKILNRDEFKRIELATIKNESITSLDLMERAASEFVQWFVQHYKASHRVGIICGTGNNGGDGLSIARMLKSWSYPVTVWVIEGSRITDDFETNLQRLQSSIEVIELTDVKLPINFGNNTILIDALFGTGLSRPIRGFHKEVVEAINRAMATRISVDVPSGLQLETHSEGAIVKANYSITFHTPKLAFFLPENAGYVGQWHCVDIGLSKREIQNVPAKAYLVDQSSIQSRLKTRSIFDHKGNNGKALLIAGSYGKMGACILAAKAALRTGVGLLTVHIPSKGYTVLQTAVPEAMASIDTNPQYLSYVVEASGFRAIGVGPGLGQAKETISGLSKLLEQSCPMVMDADALNIISLHRELMHKIPKGSILSPHPKEFERMVGKWANDFERLEKQLQLAKELNLVVILKGAYSSIASPDGMLYFNSTGNPGMAKGGTGDVLTGILTSLLAQEYSALDTALIGVYLHGLAGDIAARASGMDSLIASDLIEFIPAAFLKIRA